MRPLRQVLKKCIERTSFANRFIMVRGRRFCARPRSKPGRCEIALTFDDGPHPEHTPRLLDELRTRGMRATFFVVGQKAERHADLIRRIAEEGHALGNHTFTHGDPATTSPRALVDELRRTRDVLESISGRPCTLYRPPKGTLRLAHLYFLWKEGQSVVLWNADSKDYRMTSDDEMHLWCRNYRPRPGDIVLLHDNRPYAVTAVANIAALAESRRTDFVRVSDWLGRRAGRRESGDARHSRDLREAWSR